MLVRHSCQFIHFYLPVPQGVSFVVREGIMVYRRGLERVAVHRKSIMVYGRGLKRVAVHRRGAMVYGR